MGTLWKNGLLAGYAKMEEVVGGYVHRVFPSTTVGLRLDVHRDIAHRIGSLGLRLNDDDFLGLVRHNSNLATDSVMHAVCLGTLCVAEEWAEQHEALWPSPSRAIGTRVARFPQEDSRGWLGLEEDERRVLAFWLLHPIRDRVALCAYDWVSPGGEQLDDQERFRLMELCGVPTDGALYQLRHRACVRMKRVRGWLAKLTDRTGPAFPLPMLPEALVAALRGTRRDPKRRGEQEQLFTTLAWLRSQM